MRVASHPPQFLAQSTRSFHLRSLATAALVSSQFTIAQLANMLGVIAKTATTSNFLSQAFRLKRLSIWGPVATAGTPVTVILIWNNSANDFVGPPVTIVDTAVSFDWPAYVSSVPPQGSVSSKWHDSTEGDFTFTLSCPAGSTVDMEFDWVLSDSGLKQSTIAIVGATAGEVYHQITNNLTPQGVNTI